MSDNTYSIKEVSERVGWSHHMLRYYEKAGLRSETELVDERLRMLHAHREDVLTHLEALRGDLTAIERRSRFMRSE